VIICLCHHLVVDYLPSRIVARFAARTFNFQPLPMDLCRNCGGDGVIAERDVKGQCMRCWGTGTDPKSIGELQERVAELTAQYQKMDAAFQKAKERSLGRSNRDLGMTGRDLQTLKGEIEARTAQLKEELDRQGFGIQMARLAGAKASTL
jgi:hypothetical protein